MKLRCLASFSALVVLANVAACSSSTPVDTPKDAGTDTKDTSVDTGTDTGTDTGAVIDTGTDTGPEDTAPEVTDTGCMCNAIQMKECGKCGMASRLCECMGGKNGVWTDYGLCSGEMGVCIAGSKRTTACGKCGTRDEKCNKECAWEAGPCSGEGLCAEGSTEVEYGGCGVGKKRTRTCTAKCAWGAWGACVDDV